VSSVPQPKFRFVSLLLIGAACLLLSGCVYLRLLELKKQFSHFDENFTVPDTEDLTIHCLHPVLKSDDMHWLGAEPQTVTHYEDGEEWSIRWIKEPAPDIKEEHIYDMGITIRFTDEQMAEVRIPKRYLAYVSKDLLLNMLRSTGTAKVNRDEHVADAETETPASAALPSISSIQAMMGEPTRKQSAPGQIIYFYRYRLDVVKTKIKPVEVVFIFDPNSGELRKFTASLPRGNLNYSFKPKAPEAPKNTP
jgi:hypothetical protein